MSKPLPPIVHGPITLFSRVVRVTAVAANATILLQPFSADSDKLWAIEILCTKESSSEGMQTTVTKGNMAVTVSPKSVERETSAAVTVTAADADTGTPIVGAQVFLNGALVGKTGTAFGFASTPGQLNPAGLVRGPVAHHDASFTIILTDPPPAPRGKHSLNVGPAVLILNTLQSVSASWTVKTLWSPSQTFTSSSANAVITLPTPPRRRPTSASR